MNAWTRRQLGDTNTFLNDEGIASNARVEMSNVEVAANSGGNVFVIRPRSGPDPAADLSSASHAAPIMIGEPAAGFIRQAVRVGSG